MEVALRGFIALASRADVYTTSASASNVSVYTNTICVAKRLLGNTQTPELHPVDAGCFKQIKRENCFTSCGIPHTTTLPMPT